MQIKGSISYYDNATLKVNIIGYIKECYINAALMQHKFTLMQHYQRFNVALVTIIMQH